MSTAASAWRRSPGVVLCAVAGSLLFFWALFTVPYRYPPPEVISHSYYFGTTGEDARVLIAGLSGHRYDRPVRHALTPAVQICQAIENRYHPAGPARSEQFGYQLWLPNQS